MGNRSIEHDSPIKEILGVVIKDIQHVGSTSIPTIKAKPIIDITSAVDNFEAVLQFEEDKLVAAPEGMHFTKTENSYVIKYSTSHCVQN